MSAAALVVRPATEADIPAIEDMVREFVRGHPAQDQPRPRDTLREVYFGEPPLLHMLVACRGDEIVGMGQWRREYDMFWGVYGAVPEWLFVYRNHRGSGIVAAIIARIAAEARVAGCSFLHASSGNPTVSKVYERVATGTDSRDHYVSAKAFHALAELAGLSPREIVRRLPNPALNHEEP